MKYKMSLTIESKILFALIAKLMPPGIDHFDVEEMVDKPDKHSVAKLIAKNMPKNLAAPKITKSKSDRQRFIHPTGKRVQDLVVEYLEEQPNKTGKWAVMSYVVRDQGFAASSINNGISRLKKEGIIKQIGSGMYKLVEKK
jgi:hypothetical protein